MSEPIEVFFRAPITRARAGPFGPDLEILCHRLQGLDLSRRTITQYLRAAAHLIHCIEHGALPLDGLTCVATRQFARRHAPRCACPTYRPVLSNVLSVAPHLLEVLGARGRPVIPPSAEPARELPALLRRLDEHLRDDRGFTPETRSGYLAALRPLVEDTGCEELADAARWSPEQVRDYVLARAGHGRTKWSGRHAAVALRVLMRFLLFRGFDVVALLDAVPSIPNRQLATVPKILSDRQLGRLMATVNTKDPLHLRDRAMIECLATLGMRAGEVAALRLTAIDWRAAELRIERSKGRRADSLPIPPSVGEAIASYLRDGRPKTPDDHVFLRHQKPVGPFKSSGVSHVAQRAYRRANLRVPSAGAHALRRTAASRLVQRGASIKDIADLLRHRDLDTTRIYAKVDWPRLLEVALPWPTPRGDEA